MAKTNDDNVPANLLQVDWSTLPQPPDDGGANHLEGLAIPDIELPATSQETVLLNKLKGRAVVFAFPMTGRPDVALPKGWDMIPGARGCTPQACTFRDNHGALLDAGFAQVFGLSTQSTAYQQEAAQRLHLPYPLLSDQNLELTKALRLPVMEVEGMKLLRRLTLIIQDGRIEKTFYPVFPPDESAQTVLTWAAKR